MSAIGEIGGLLSAKRFWFMALWMVFFAGWTGHQLTEVSFLGVAADLGAHVDFLLVFVTLLLGLSALIVHSFKRLESEYLKLIKDIEDDESSGKDASESSRKDSSSDKD